ncbi:VWA domain-containing protein [Streptomyces sp. VRA16 Mangrove soil]|nr:VWA domain-containing protein [Streptomyces sp. VRA16 Mangrove soil]
MAADVPSPAADEAVVTVKTGGDRDGDSSVAPLAGVQLALYASETATAPVADAWARCTSDGDGDCSFTIPDVGSGGVNEGQQFWVRQVDGGVPAGWYTNPTLRTGKGSGSSSEESTYQFRTPALAAGRTYSSTSDFMYSTAWSTTPYLASGGIWQQSRTNPEMPESCGLDIAVVLDLSSSVGSALPDLKAATDKLTNTLTGTPSRMALFSFDKTSPPTTGVSANHPGLMSVSTQAGADAFKALYADWTLGSGTNWDQAMYAVAKAAPTYDLVVVLTDGNPTRWNNPYTGDGSNTHFADVEGGIFAANAVKAKGSRVVAVGVGKGVEGVSGLNLRAISGEEAFTGSNPTTADYYQTDDFAAAGEALHNLALTHCDGTLSVIKQIVPAGTTGEDVTGAENAPAGWQFDASTTTAGMGGLPDTQTTGDDGTGGVVFNPTYPAGTTDADITVAESQQSGYDLVTQGGKNAVCTDLDTGAAVDVVNTGTAASPGFTVNVPSLAAISCVVHNRPPQTADVEVTKTWEVDGVRYAHADRPDGLDAGLTLTGPSDTAPHDQAWGEVREGYTVGDTTTVAETPTLPAACTLTDSRVTGANGTAVDEPVPYEAELTREHNTFAVLNKVVCKARLTLVKQVVNEHGGTAAATDWTLSADGPSDLSGVTGADAVTGADIEAGRYTLGESGGPEGYDAGDWACETAGGTALAVTDEKVTVPAGADVTCTVTNTDRAVSTPTPTPTPTVSVPGTPTPTPAPGDNGHGGELADTGSGFSVTGWSALAAALLVAAGTVLVARRQRRR